MRSGCLFLLAIGYLVSTGCDAEEEEGAPGTDGDAAAGMNTPAGPATLTGEYVAAFSGDVAGLAALRIDDEGRMKGLAVDSAGNSLEGCGQLEEGGAATLQLSGTTEVGVATLSYEGTFRLEDRAAFGTGTWQTDTGASGAWGAWRPNDGPVVDPATLAGACEAIRAHCSFPIEQAECLSVARCQSSFMASASPACRANYLSVAEPIVGLDGPDGCPDFETNLFDEQTCPSIPGCSGPIPASPADTTCADEG